MNPSPRLGGWKVLEAPLGLALNLVSRGVILSSSILEEHAAPIPEPAIFVNWHRHLPFLTVHHGRRGRWMLMSSAPRMAPIARWATQSGLRLVRGASGERGKEALPELAAILQRNKSVVLAVDGPRGPAFVVRPGCVTLARMTGVPIVPVAYEANPPVTVPLRWDAMSVALPLSRIKVRYGAPLTVSESETDAEALQRVSYALDALDPTVPQLRNPMERT